MWMFCVIGLIALLGAMVPGPDFVIVTRNTLLYSKKAGYFTALGVGSAIVIHMSYCLLGLALVIAASFWLLTIIKWLGALYLSYLGINSLRLSVKVPSLVGDNPQQTGLGLTKIQAFKQGFFCNLLNPKATLFFLAIFTVIMTPNTPVYWQIIYALEIITIATLWFCLLTTILSQVTIKRLLARAEYVMAKLLGILLIVFAVTLVLV